MTIRREVAALLGLTHPGRHEHDRIGGAERPSPLRMPDGRDEHSMRTQALRRATCVRSHDTRRER